jgi:hypothetical protein
MGVTIQEENGNLTVTITGRLKKSELDTVQSEGTKKLGANATVKLLIILKDFEGWEHGEGWDDMTFYFEHGDKITKIAIVGDSKWEDEFKMFVGAGFRTAPVKYFPANQLTNARDWLA